MSPKLSSVRIVALALATLVAAYLSSDYWGGVLVFGNRIKTVSDFFYVWAPTMALPAALVAWWKSRLGAILFGLVILTYFGVLLKIAWPRVGAVATHTLHQLWPFMVGWSLLLFVALFDRRHAKGRSHRSRFHGVRVVSDDCPA